MSKGGTVVCYVTINKLVSKEIFTMALLRSSKVDRSGIGLLGMRSRPREERSHPDARRMREHKLLVDLRYWI